MGAADATPGGPSSRTLIFVLLILAAVVALLPVLVGRSPRVETMRSGLGEVLGECRERYAAARTAVDTAAVDAWRPTLHGEDRPGDPGCGSYRKRNMVKAARP